jgi:hypothetical protein
MGGLRFTASFLICFIYANFQFYIQTALKHPILSNGNAVKETPRRRIAVTSSLNEIYPNQLKNRVVARGEALLRPIQLLSVL